MKTPFDNIFFWNAFSRFFNFFSLFFWNSFSILCILQYSLKIPPGNWLDIILKISSTNVFGNPFDNSFVSSFYQKHLLEFFLKWLGILLGGSSRNQLLQVFLKKFPYGLLAELSCFKRNSKYNFRRVSFKNFWRNFFKELLNELWSFSAFSHMKKRW